MAHPIAVADARMIFKNFSGIPDTYNKEGKRSFALALDPDGTLIQELKDEGWNVKVTNANSDDPEAEHIQYLPVEVRADNYPPKVVFIADKEKTLLQPTEYDLIDSADIEHVDLVITPYNYDFNGNKGIKAYLKSLYVTVKTDEFTKKYGI